jgi:hypothetical protein
VSLNLGNYTREKFENDTNYTNPYSTIQTSGEILPQSGEKSKTGTEFSPEDGLDKVLGSDGGSETALNPSLPRKINDLLR